MIIVTTDHYLTLVSCKTLQLDALYNLILYTKEGFQYECTQANQRIQNHTKQLGKGNIMAIWLYYDYLFLYIPPNSYVIFAATENSAQVVPDEVREWVYPGQLTQIALRSKTN